jgi:hypothetical protein
MKLKEVHKLVKDLEPLVDMTAGSASAASHAASGARISAVTRPKTAPANPSSRSWRSQEAQQHSNGKAQHTGQARTQPQTHSSSSGTGQTVRPATAASRTSRDLQRQPARDSVSRPLAAVRKDDVRVPGVEYVHDHDAEEESCMHVSLGQSRHAGGKALVQGAAGVSDAQRTQMRNGSGSKYVGLASSGYESQYVSSSSPSKAEVGTGRPAGDAAGYLTSMGPVYLVSARPYFSGM